MQDHFYFESKPQSKQDLFFDSHCHLQYAPISENLEQTIQDAKAVGLKKLICIGIDYKTSVQAIEIAKQYPDYVFVAVGDHPCEHNQEVTPMPKDKFRKLIQDNLKHIAAIGETGLDLHHNDKFLPQQLQSLQDHIDLAQEFDLPIVLHVRPYETCFDPIWQVLEERDVKKAIFHCYSGNMQQAQKIWSKGYKTSFSLIVTYPKNTELKEVYQTCPFENLLIETDSPFLPPQSKRGQKCYPHYLQELDF